MYLLLVQQPSPVQSLGYVLTLSQRHRKQNWSGQGVGTKPGLWTMDWTMDWIMDSILDLILDRTALCIN